MPIEELADYVVKSVEEAMLIGNPDAAIIASPSPFHVSDAKQFIANGCPVFIEKPLSNSSDELCSLIELAETNDVVCMVAYVLRFLPTMQKIKGIILGNELGNILHATISVGQHLPSWRPDQDYRKTVSAQKNMGGGALLELSHEIDYMLYLFGSPSKVSANIRSSGSLQIDVEDHVDSMFVYESGFVVNLHLDFLQKVASRYCHITMDEGYINWDLASGDLTTKSILTGTPKSETVETITNDIYIAELEHFFECIENNSEPLVDIADGAKVLYLIDTMQEASLTNTTINFPKLEAKDND